MPLAASRRGTAATTLTVIRHLAGRDASGTVEWVGLARAVVAQRPRGGDELVAEWIRGHVDLGAVAEGLERDDVNMSHLVDELDGKAAAEAAPPPVVVKSFLASLDQQVKRTRGVAQVLAIWPPPPRAARAPWAEGGEGLARAVAPRARRKLSLHHAA